MKTFLIVMALVLTTGLASAQVTAPKWSASYEILEMSANKFRYFAGDAAYRLNEKNQLRIVVMEVKLTERHLSDDTWAKIVDGPHMTGYMRGYELNLDHFLTPRFYVMANLGYIHFDFENAVSRDSYSNSTLAMGSGFGYRWNLPVLDRRFYVNPSIPIRYFFNPVEETQLGDSKVNPITIAPSVWIFLGYQF